MDGDGTKHYFYGNSGFSIFECMAKVLDERGDWKRETQISGLHRCDLVLGDRFAIPYENLRTIPRHSGSKCLVNYFKGSHRLTLKASMTKLVREAIPHAAEYFPPSFVIGNSKPSKSRFAAAEKTADERTALLQSAAEHPDLTWIAKPSAGCKGEGITIWRNAAEAVAHIDKTLDGNTGLYVVQQYVANPLLLEGKRKFDIRVWALVAPLYKIYVYSQGSCRTASAAYDPSDLSATLAHLTNHGLQESSEDFGKFEQGNEIWYSQLDRFLRAEKAASFEDAVKPQINRIVMETLLAAKELIEVGDHESFESFQLFGFDLMLDETLRLHLIEINGSPGAADRWLLPLVSSIVELVIDPRFSPTAAAAPAIQSQSESIKQLSAADNETGQWECVWFPESLSAKHDPEVTKTSSEA
jgi:tubulin--tyrosine ligase